MFKEAGYRLEFDTAEGKPWRYAPKPKPPEPPTPRPAGDPDAATGISPDRRTGPAR